MNGLSRPKPESGVELYAWFFMRISGIVLLLLVLGHFTIMHLINNIEVINYEFVARRFATPFWRTYDLVMLWLALLHGVNGVRTLVDDYIHARGWRIFALSTLYVLGFMILALGSLVLVVFQPVANP
jgi:succinate dehydrogenase / fumarate reductase membrane anchor subunit